jgi:hypothetical protein
MLSEIGDQPQLERVHPRQETPVHEENAAGVYLAWSVSIGCLKGLSGGTRAARMLSSLSRSAVGSTDRSTVVSAMGDCRAPFRTTSRLAPASCPGISGRTGG